jgi:hypothetical protein
MDIEQLKMILDAASVAGAGGKELFYVFMGVSVLKTFITACVILVLIFFAVKIIGRLITDNSEAEKLRMAAGVSHSWRENELDLACYILKKYFKEEVEKQGGVW